MSMICSALAIDASTLLQLRRDEELVLGVTSLAYGRMREHEFEQHIQELPEGERSAARQRWQEAQAASRERVPKEFAAQMAEMDALEARAASLNLRGAMSLEKSWDALHHLFELAGGSIFDGEPLGSDQGYGPAVLRTPTNVTELSNFLNGPGAAQIEHADMMWLRDQRVYAWPEPDDATVDDEEMREHLNRYFETFRAYVTDAAERGDAMLIWIS